MESRLLSVLSERGFIHQCTDLEALDRQARERSIRGYIGFDCTADSLHVGSLVQLMLLRWLQRLGHKPLVIVGAGTTKIGDPSGKDSTRRLLSEERIAHNLEGIKTTLAKFLTFGHGETDALLINNADWLDDLQYIPFLREIGRHFTINRMLTFESVKTRLARSQPLSFLEFNYMILQAYDFLELSRRYGCRLQIGGADQWGNIVNGIELTRRLETTTLYGLTTPLLTTASGEKMGKTASGAVWLDEDKVSPYEYWQFWRNTADSDTPRFLRLFTELSLEEIEDSLDDINQAKKTLAYEATKLCHGEERARDLTQTASAIFEQKESTVTQGLPLFEVEEERFEEGISVLEVLRLASLSRSKAEARRLIRSRGVKLNGFVVEDEGRQIQSRDLAPNDTLHITVGKKRHVLVKSTTKANNSTRD